MENLEKLDPKFFFKKKILVTGHTGFKGSWMTMLLNSLDASVKGYSLETSNDENLFDLCGLSNDCISIAGNINDYEKLKKELNNFDHLQLEAFLSYIVEVFLLLVLR